MSDTYDVAIVGGGPAGLSAATELRRLGIGRVVVLERFEEAGGIPRHCGHPPFGWREFRRVLTGPDYARRLVATAQAAGVEIRTRCSVTRINVGGELVLATTEGAAVLRAERIILATGNRESTRAQWLAPGLRPVGVMNTAALQSFATLEQKVPFRRPVILGSELVSLSALLTCRRHGIRPVALVETNAAVRTRSVNMLLPRLLGVPVFIGAELVAIEGRTRVEGLRLHHGGHEKTLECDGIVFSGRFTPEAALARTSLITLDPGTLGPLIDGDWRSSDPRVFVVGNVLHPVETAGYCWDEGRRVARLVAQDLAKAPQSQAGARIVPGKGLRYAVPQRVAGGPSRLNIRAEGAVRGQLVLRDGLGRAHASTRVRSHPEQPLRLTVPALDSGALAGDLRLTLETEG